MCLEIGAVALIDDSFSYAKDCAKAGIPVVLFGDYAWNRSHCVQSLNEDREMVVRVKDWEEALNGIHRLLNLQQSSIISNQSIAKKPVLACDIDEVLAHFIPSLALFHNDQYHTSLTTDDFSSYEFHLIWGGTVEECNYKMELFYESDFFLSHIRPVHTAFECLQQLSKDFELHVVTARQNKLKDVTTSWVDTHYPGMFSNIHFGNHYSTEGKKRSKSEMCLEINAVALIDDSFAYAKDCANAGIPVVLFGDYPWNRSHCIAHLNESKEMVVRVRDWQEAICGLHRLLQLQQ